MSCLPGLLFMLSANLCTDSTSQAYIYTLSLHDALPILQLAGIEAEAHGAAFLRHVALLGEQVDDRMAGEGDRKSTRLNSSHVRISYAVSWLKKKNHTLSILPRSGSSPGVAPARPPRSAR